MYRTIVYDYNNHVLNVHESKYDISETYMNLINSAKDEAFVKIDGLIVRKAEIFMIRTEEVEEETK